MTATWTLTLDGRTVSVAARTTVGRADDNDVTLDDPRVSPHHAVLEVDGAGHLVVTDLGSGGGTLLDELTLHGLSATVADGARLTLGGTEIAVSGPAPASLGPTPAAPSAGAAPAVAPMVPAAAGPPASPAPAPPSASPGAGAPPASPAPALPPAPPSASPATQTTAPRAARDEPPPARQSQSTVSRVLPRAIADAIGQTQRRVRIATIVALAAVAVAIVAVALAVTGELSPKSAPAKTPKPPLTVSQIVQGARHSVVFVQAVDGAGDKETGSGWVVNGPAGEIVTNAHVVEGGPSLLVNLPDQPQQPANLVGINRCQDVALLKVADTQGLRTLPQGRQLDTQEGDQTIAIGFPYSAANGRTDLTATTGVVSVADTSAPYYPDVIETDAPINPGNSGGPLLNGSGRIIGMDTFSSSTGQNQDYAIAVDQIDRLLPGLRAGDDGSWAGISLSYDDSDYLPDATLSAGHSELFGPEITGIFPGAHPGAGITGDTGETKQFLVAINGVPFVPYAEVGQRTDAFNGRRLPSKSGRQLQANETGYCAETSTKTAGETVPVTVLTLGSDNAGSTRNTTLHFQ